MVSTVFACVMFGIHVTGTGLKGGPWIGLLKEKNLRDFSEIRPLRATGTFAH
jgi:hypothetical protein